MDQEQLLLKESGGTRSLGRNALSLTVVSAMGVGCSLLVDALVVAYFGLGWNTDAYFVAMTVPMLLATALALQASQVVQPLFIHTREEEGEQPGWDVLNLIITTSTGIVFILAVLGVLSSALLIRTQSPGLDERSLALATRLSWLFFLILPMYCPITIVSGALTRFGSFALPGAAALFVSVSRLIFLVIFHRQLGVFALAWGTSVGLLTHLALSYWALRKRGYRYQWHFSLRHPLFARSCRMMRFPLTAQLAGVGAEVANNALGSMVGAGAISALRVATRIVDSLAGLFGSGIVTATAPTLTGNLAVGDTGKARESLRNALHLLLLVTIPLSMWLAVMGQPLIAFLYQRKNFTTADTHLVAGVLMLMIPYICFSRLWGLSELVFIGRCDTRTPFIGSLLISSLFIGTSLVLYSRLHLYAMPVGRSAAYLIGSLAMLYLAQRDLGGLGLRRLGNSTGRIVIASMAMAASTLIVLRLIDAVPLHGFLKQAVNLGVPSLAGGAVLLWALLMLGVVKGASLYSLPGIGRLLVRT